MIDRLTEDFFRRDVRHHNMEILLDQGVYRHLKFKQPVNTFRYWFEIITSPGLLTINGDMGTFVFSRLHDMFQFFRSEVTEPSFGYIAEKCRAGKTREFSESVARAAIADRAAECLDKEQLTEEETEELFDELLLNFDGGENVLLESLRDHWSDSYDLKAGDKTYPGFFEDFCQSFESYTLEFQWCVRAIRWAIEQYDKAKSTLASASNVQING